MKKLFLVVPLILVVCGCSGNSLTPDNPQDVLRQAWISGKDIVYTDGIYRHFPSLVPISDAEVLQYTNPRTRKVSHRSCCAELDEEAVGIKTYDYWSSFGYIWYYKPGNTEPVLFMNGCATPVLAGDKIRAVKLVSHPAPNIYFTRIVEIDKNTGAFEYLTEVNTCDCTPWTLLGACRDKYAAAQVDLKEVVLQAFLWVFDAETHEELWYSVDYYQGLSICKDGSHLIATRDVSVPPLRWGDRHVVTIDTSDWTMETICESTHDSEFYSPMSNFNATKIVATRFIDGENTESVFIDQYGGQVITTYGISYIYQTAISQNGVHIILDGCEDVYQVGHNIMCATPLRMLKDQNFPKINPAWEVVSNGGVNKYKAVITNTGLGLYSNDGEPYVVDHRGLTNEPLFTSYGGGWDIDFRFAN